MRVVTQQTAFRLSGIRWVTVRGQSGDNLIDIRNAHPTYKLEVGKRKWNLNNVRAIQYHSKSRHPGYPKHVSLHYLER
jgi:hypothetical protein